MEASMALVPIECCHQSSVDDMIAVRVMYVEVWPNVCWPIYRFCLFARKIDFRRRLTTAEKAEDRARGHTQTMHGRRQETVVETTSEESKNEESDTFVTVIEYVQLLACSISEISLK